MYEKLIKYLGNNQYKKAEAYIEVELAKNPCDVYLLTQMAYVLYKQNKEKRALDYAAKAEAIECKAPMLLYTAGIILKSMDMFDESIRRWDIILGMDIHVLEEKCQGKSRALSIQNDARFYKAHCLFCKYHNAEAEVLLKEHIAHRRRGLESDFTISEVREFAKILKYAPKPIEPSSIDYPSGYPTIEQGHRMENHILKLEKSKDWEPLKRYIKRKCREFPNDYWLKTKMAEYLYLEKDKGCLKYARDAYSLASDDMLVVYDYACALYLNEEYEKATDCLNVIIGKGLDYIAYSEHGEGLRWAKSLMADAKALLTRITRNRG